MVTKLVMIPASYIGIVIVIAHQIHQPCYVTLVTDNLIELPKMPKRQQNRDKRHRHGVVC